MRIRSTNQRVQTPAVTPLPTKARAVQRGSHAQAAPLIVPPHFGEALRKSRASTPEKSAPAKRVSQPSPRHAAVIIAGEPMPPLTIPQVRSGLKTIPQWTKRGQTLVRTFQCEGFLQSLDFVRRIGRRAERNQHHPDLAIRFDTVTVTLTTKDAGGITEKDFSLARQCDGVFLAI